jgi:hypothetical protein
VQAHPEFVPDYSSFLIKRRRSSWTDEKVDSALASLQQGHEGDAIARMMIAFVQGDEALAKAA